MSFEKDPAARFDAHRLSVGTALTGPRPTTPATRLSIAGDQALRLRDTSFTVPATPGSSTWNILSKKMASRASLSPTSGRSAVRRCRDDASRLRRQTEIHPLRDNIVDNDQRSWQPAAARNRIRRSYPSFSSVCSVHHSVLQAAD